MTTKRPAATRDDATTRDDTNDDTNDDDAIATARDAAVETATTTLARARDDAVRRARDSRAEPRSGDGDDDDAIARAKRAVTLGRRVSEKTTRTQHTDDGETRRAAVVRDRAKHLIVDARDRVDACARAVEVHAHERDDDDDEEDR